MKRQGKDATQTMWKAHDEVEVALTMLVKAETLQDIEKWTGDYLDSAQYHLQEAINLITFAQKQWKDERKAKEANAL